MSGTASDIVGEERLLPVVRAKLAERLSRDGFRVREIARALNVTPAAVTQYLKHKRGTGFKSLGNVDALIGPLAERLVARIRSGSGGLETVELLETARQLIVVNSGRRILQAPTEAPERDASLALLRQRLRLELSAAEKYLELSNRTTDDYTKLLLRMIASDSMRHADVVSQILSWLEAGGGSAFEIPSDAVLESMLSIEDSAKEASLKKSVEVNHPVARLLLEWIDIDESKHGRIIGRVLGLTRRRHGRAR